MTQGKKKSTFITQDSVPDDHFIDTFGNGVNRKIPKTKFFEQIRKNQQTFIYENEADLQAANLEADPDDPVYVRVAETGFWLYQITSLAATALDISLDNGTTATRISEETAVIPLSDITSLSSLNPAALVDGQQFHMTGWRTGSDLGGGDLYYDSSRPQTDHDGGTVFALGATPPTDFNDPAQIEAYLNAGSGLSGNGCLVRENRGRLGVWLEDYGATGNFNDDAYPSWQAAIDSGKPILLGHQSYRSSKPFEVPDNFTIIGMGVKKSFIVFDLPGAPIQGGEAFFTNIGGEGVNISNLSAIHSDTTTRQTLLLSVQSFDGVKLDNIETDAFRIFGALQSSNIQITNCRRLPIAARFDSGDDEDGGAIASFQQCSGLTLTGLRGEDLAEGVDFGGSDNVTLDDFRFVSRPSADFNDGIDAGFVNNVTIGSGYIHGFGQSIFIKEELLLGCSDVTIGQVICEEFAAVGLQVFSRTGGSVGGTPVMRDITANGSSFISTVAGSRGVLINNTGETSGSERVRLNGVTAITEDSALEARAIKDLEVNGGYYESQTASAIDVQDSSTLATDAVAEDIYIAPYKAISHSASSADGAIRMLRVKRPTVCPVEIESDGNARGINLSNCLHPTVKDPRILDANRGVRLFWDSESWLIEGTSATTGITVEGVKSKNWRDALIYIQFSGIGSAGAYRGGSIQNNHGMIASEGTEEGITFEGIPQDYWDYVNFSGNSFAANNAIALESRLGANSILANNIDLNNPG